MAIQYDMKLAFLICWFYKWRDVVDNIVILLLVLLTDYIRIMLYSLYVDYIKLLSLYYQIHHF